jgi:predicted phosphodiesterase
VKIAIVSDIHSNLEALKAVEAEIERQGVDKVYFVGDVVGYGPEPSQCTAWVREHSELAVAGNHDHGILGKTDIEGFNENARRAVMWNAEVMEEDDLAYLDSLPFSAVSGDVTIVHANPRSPETWDYIFTLWDAETNFAHFEGRFCFVGHSHQPVMVTMDETGMVSVIPGDTVEIEDSSRYLINVGSVGQPRDGNPAASFGILDFNEARFSLVRAAYDIGATQAKMAEVGLPQPLVDRLSEGR